MIYLIIIFVLMLDFFISYFLPSYFNSFSYFPLFTLTFLVFYFKKSKSKNYLKHVLITGFFYDLLFSYVFLFNTLIFLLFGKFLIKVDKLVRYNFFVGLIMLVFFIFLYDFILFVLVYISEYNIVSINDLIYKVSHSLLLNVSFYLLLIIIFHNKKYLS